MAWWELKFDCWRGMYNETAFFTVLTLLMLTALLLSAIPTVAAEAVVATEEDVILLAGSDFQVSGNNTHRIEEILTILEVYGLTKADGAFLSATIPSVNGRPIPAPPVLRRSGSCSIPLWGTI